MAEQSNSDSIENIEDLDLEEILEHLDSFDRTPPKPKLVPNEEDLKQRFPVGEWSVDGLEDLLDMTGPAIQRILRMISSYELVNALYLCSDELKQHIITNMSRRADEMLEDDLKMVHPATTPPSSLEIKGAQEELIRISTEQYAEMEQEEWDKLMYLLPSEPLPHELDLNLLFSLDVNATKNWMEKVVSMEQLVHAVALDDEWYPLWEKEIEPQISKKALELLAEDIETLQPQFSWQVEVSRRLITFHAQNSSSQILSCCNTKDMYERE